MFFSIVQLPTQRYQRKRSISGESWVKCIHGENERRIKSEEVEHVKKANFQEKGSQQCPWEHEKWRQSWSHLGTNLPLSQMRKLRLRESMRPSQGHCPRRWQKSTAQFRVWVADSDLAMSQGSRQPLWRTCSLSAPALLPRITTPSEPGQWPGTTGEGWKDICQHSECIHSDGPSSSLPWEEHCPSWYWTGGKTSVILTWSCPGETQTTEEPHASPSQGSAASRRKRRQHEAKGRPDKGEGAHTLSSEMWRRLIYASGHTAGHVGRSSSEQGDHIYSAIPGGVVCDL